MIVRNRRPLGVAYLRCPLCRGERLLELRYRPAVGADDPVRQELNHVPQRDRYTGQFDMPEYRYKCRNCAWTEIWTERPLEYSKEG